MRNHQSLPELNKEHNKNKEFSKKEEKQTFYIFIFSGHYSKIVGAKITVLNELGLDFLEPGFDNARWRSGTLTKGRCLVYHPGTT